MNRKALSNRRMGDCKGDKGKGGVCKVSAIEE